MHVHQTDLAPEEGAGFRALKVALQAAVVRQRPVEQARAIGASRCCRISSTCRSACSRVNRFDKIPWIIGSRL